MGYEILRILYATWFFGGLILFFNALSALLFAKRNRCAKKLKALLTTLAFCIFWPLAIMSPDGRKVLFGKFNHL